MSVTITTIYNSSLYYWYLFLVAKYVLNCVPKRNLLLYSFIVFSPFIITVVFPGDNTLAFARLFFVLFQFLALRFSFVKIKIWHLIFAYIFLYSINALIISIISSVIPQHYLYIDVIVNTITVSICTFICFTKTRNYIHDILLWTPKYIMVISAFLLTISAIVSAIISYLQSSRFPEVLGSWIQTLTSFLLMAICLVVPVIFVISISNTRLKTLTVDYEQQIHAQAEHYKNLAAANYEARRFRHDFKNIQIAIESLLTQEKYAEATDLIRQCSHQLDQSVAAKAKFDTGNGIADALLTDKQEKATDYNATISFDGIIPAETLSPTDLCVLLGNSLDNALDACKQMPEDADKTIAVSCNCSSGFLFLTVTNPIDHAVQIRGNHIATTKENKTLHGFGLYSLHTIVKKYDGEIQLSATEDSFTISIDLCMMSARAKASPA